ncbi:MAG TPA: universal stress protein [Stellaceae bacterium]|nr:universal stress protein [Stellaceae bacterium]
MALKDILLYVDEARGHDARIALAVELARRNGAHLTGLFSVEPYGYSALAAPGGPDFAATEAFQELEEQRRATRLALGEGLRDELDKAAQRAGINREWRVVEDPAAEAMALHARYADLAVVGQADPDNRPVGAGVVEAVLLSAGRPVLAVPFIGAASLGQRVLIAWNASREAARAVNDALPLLTAAERVTVLSINPAQGIADEGELPAVDIALHLARHGVKAEAAHTESEDIGVGDVILSRAADLSADLIVMGGYGHSRAREFILGGATRTLLQSMTVPVLLSH